MNINKISFTSTLILSAFLTACGGGSGSGDSQSGAGDVSTAEGVYSGTISNGLEHNTIVLEDGQFYTLYGSTIGSVSAVFGFVQGQGKDANGSFSSTNARDYWYDGTVLTGSLSASYVQGVSFNGTITGSDGDTVTFTSAPITGSLYDYNTAANLANITGTWDLISIQGATVALNILPNGTFTGSSDGCSINGTFQPRPSGKNVFNVTFTFGAAPCSLPHQAANGIAIEYPHADGSQQFIVAGTNSNRTQGTAFMGLR